MAAGAKAVALLPTRGPGVIVVDRSTLRSDTIGLIPGEGPGEMRSPAGIWFEGDSLAVYDIALARITLYGPDWEYLRSETNLPIASNMTGGGSGYRVFLNAQSATYGLLTQAGARGARQLPDRLVARARGSSDLAAFAGDRLFIYDGTAGAILTLTADGRSTREPAPLPPLLRERLVAVHDSLNRLSRRPVPDALPMAKFMLGDGAGRAVLFFWLPGRSGYAVRFDPADGSFVDLGGVSDSAAYLTLQRASNGAIVDSTMYVTQINETRVFRLSSQ